MKPPTIRCRLCCTMVKVLKNGKLASHYDDYQWRCERCPGAGLDAAEVLREWGGVNAYSGGKGVTTWLLFNGVSA